MLFSFFISFFSLSDCCDFMLRFFLFDFDLMLCVVLKLVEKQIYLQVKIQVIKPDTSLTLLISRGKFFFCFFFVHSI